ncbi:MAG TPA: transporter [Verrucomicrobiae bacterium]
MKTNQHQKTRTALALVAGALLSIPGVLQAQPSAHYVPGVEGLKGASLPPPGFYLRDYNAFYFADRVNDSDGKKARGPAGEVDAEAFIYANVPRLIWITDLQLLGGNIGVDALLPLQYTDLKITGGPRPVNDGTFGIGDLFAETTWSKHIEKFDFSLGAGVWVPTGDSSPVFGTTRAGSGFWTAMLTAGATWYVDADKLWAISALNRYEFNSQKEGATYTPGQAYTLEWGISRALSKTVDVGVVGYYQQQVTEDSGSGKTTPERDRVAAVGPEVNVFYPKFKLGWSLRYDYEFMAESRLQGHTVALTITKIF